MMMAWKLAPAIAGGNTVVFKPSEQTPLTALKMAKVLADILPEGVVNVVLGRGESVGNALINHPKINMVSITGDVATGKKVLQAAAKSVKRTHLELGGKAPVIVFDDADLDAVVGGLRAFGYYNAGQDCTAACRIYAGKKDLRQAGRRPLVGRLDHQVRPARRHRKRDRAADLASASAIASRASSSARPNSSTSRSPPAARRRAAAGSSTSRPSSPGLAGRRDRAARGVRPGGFGHPLLGRCDEAVPGRTTATTALPPRSGPKMSAAPWRLPRACNMAAPGSTPTSC
jgi:hypothetical protein